MLLLLIPVSLFRSAGFGATTIVYVWPLAITMPVFVLLKHELCGCTIPFSFKVLGLLCAACGATEFLLVFSLVAHCFPFFQSDRLAKFCDFSSLAVSIKIVIYCLILCCFIISLYYAGGKGEYGFLTSLIFLADFCTRFIICFSPTCYASLERIAYFMLISVIIVTTMLIFKLDFKRFMAYDKSL